MHTPEEIDLCRQIAEKHRKEIKRGDWILDENDELCLVEFVKDNILTISLYGDAIRYVSQDNPNITPLWTISDCLEWLKKRRWINCHFYPVEEGKKIEWSIVHVPFRWQAQDQIIVQGKTLLEGSLRAVLAVLSANRRRGD